MKNVMIIVFVLCVCSSCVTKKQVEYVDRDVVRYVTKVQHDTLVQNVHDSIYHTVFQVGEPEYSKDGDDKVDKNGRKQGVTNIALDAED